MWSRYRHDKKAYSEVHVYSRFMLISAVSLCWPNGKVSASRVADLGSIPAFAVGSCSKSSHTSDLKTGTPVATLPGTKRYRVSAGTGWPDVNKLCLGAIESLICNFSVWQHVYLSEQIRHRDTLTCPENVKQPTDDISTGFKIFYLTLYDRTDCRRT